MGDINLGQCSVSAAGLQCGGRSEADKSSIFVMFSYEFRWQHGEIISCGDRMVYHQNPNCPNATLDRPHHCESHWLVDYILSMYVMTSRDETVGNARCVEASELYRLLCTMNGRCAVWWHGCFYALVRRHRDLNVNPAIEQDTLSTVQFKFSGHKSGAIVIVLLFKSVH